MSDWILATNVFKKYLPGQGTVHLACSIESIDISSRRNQNFANFKITITNGPFQRGFIVSAEMRVSGERAQAHTASDFLTTHSGSVNRMCTTSRVTSTPRDALYLRALCNCN